MIITNEKMLKVFRKKVFIYASPEADERFFRSGIADFLRKDNQEGFKQHLIDMIHERNGGGHTTKYMFFHNKAQRLYIDNNFFEWAKLVSKIMAEELKQINDNEK